MENDIIIKYLIDNHCVVSVVFDNFGTMETLGGCTIIFQSAQFVAVTHPHNGLTYVIQKVKLIQLRTPTT